MNQQQDDPTQSMKSVSNQAEESQPFAHQVDEQNVEVESVNEELEQKKTFGPLAVFALFALGALIAAFVFFGIPALRPLYSVWRVDQQITQAEKLNSTGDFRSAIIMLRNAFRHASNLSLFDPRRLELIKRIMILMADSAKMAGDSEYPLYLGYAYEQDPKDEQLAIRTVRAVIESKRYDLANVLLPTISQNFPNSAEILHLVGIMLLERGELDAGYTALKRAAELDPNKKSIRLSLGTIEALSKDPEVAERGRRIIQEARQDPEFYKVATSSLAEVLSINEPIKSLELWDELVQKFPQEFDLRIKRLNIAHTIRPSETRAEIDRLWSQFTNFMDRVQLIIRTFGWLGVDQARELYERLPSVDRATPSAKLLLISLDSAQEKWSEVLNLARELSTHKDAPTHQQVVAWLWMARAQRMLGNDDVVTTSLRNAAQIASEMPALLLLSGQQLESWNMHAEAQIFYRNASRLGGPVQLLALNNMARFAQDQRNTTDLLEIYENLLKLQPNNALVLNNLAALLLMRNQDVKRALELSQQVYMANVANQRVPQIADTYALALALNGRVAEALDIYNMIPINALDNNAIRLHYARVLALAGRKDEAWQIIQPINASELFREEQDTLEQLRRQLL